MTLLPVKYFSFLHFFRGENISLLYTFCIVLIFQCLQGYSMFWIVVLTFYDFDFVREKNGSDEAIFTKMRPKARNEDIHFRGDVLLLQIQGYMLCI